MAVLFGAMMLQFGCKNAGFSSEYNKQRRRIGLPIIEKNWVNYNKFNNAQEAAWSIPGTNFDEPCHSGKKVFYESGKWKEEEDYYYSGKKYMSGDPDAGKLHESITINYRFGENGIAGVWTCHYQGANKAIDDTITLKEAEEILKSWGLTRLNYKKP